MIKVGLVGAGGMGVVHYNNYKEIEGCSVVAVVGKSDNDIQKSKEWNIPCFRSITEMIENAEVDVVDICTPTFLHYEQVMESLSLGKDTIVEKPIALKSSQAKEMIEKAKEKECHLYVAQVVQFTKEIQILKELVRTKKYGKVMDAYFERLTACPKWVQGGWLFDESKSGLLLFDLHIHDLDVIVSLFGKPEKIAVHSTQREESEFVEHYRLQYTYDQLNVVAECAWFHADLPFTAKWRICFENAVLVYDGQSLIAYPYEEGEVVYCIEDEVKIPTGINVPPTGWYFNELSHFIECIRQGQGSDVVTERQLIETLEVVERVKEI